MRFLKWVACFLAVVIGLLVLAYVLFYAMLLTLIFGFIWLEEGTLLYRLLAVLIIVLVIKVVRRKRRERRSNG